MYDNVLICVVHMKSEFDENETSAAAPELARPDDKESRLDLPEDLNLDDDDAADDAKTDEAQDAAADDVEGDLSFLSFSYLLYCG